MEYQSVFGEYQAVPQITIDDLNFTNATGSNLYATNIYGSITGPVGTLTNIIASNSSLGSATASSITSGPISGTIITGNTGNISTLSSTSANITSASIPTLISTSATITTASIPTLTSTNSNITNGTIGSLTSTSANITSATIPTLTSTTVTVNGDVNTFGDFKVNNPNNVNDYALFQSNNSLSVMQLVNSNNALMMFTNQSLVNGRDWDVNSNASGLNWRMRSLSPSFPSWMRVTYPGSILVEFPSSNVRCNNTLQVDGQSTFSSLATFTSASITSGTVGTLASTTSNIDTLTATNANITSLTCGSLSLASASFPSLTATNANITNLTTSSINNSVIDIINSGTTQTLNIGTSSSTTVSKDVNIGSTTNDVTAGTALVRIGRNAMLEFGAGVSGKEANAGKIGYGTFDTTALNIVGSGTGTSRLIRMYDAVGINAAPTTNAALTTSGAITIGGSARLNLLNTSYSVRAEASSLRFYANNATTSMLNLENTTRITTAYPIRTTSNVGFTNGSFTTILTAGTQAANRTITFPTVASNADVVLTQSDQTIVGTKTFTDSVSQGRINLFNAGYSVRADNAAGAMQFYANAAASPLLSLDQVANRVDANTVHMRSTTFRVRSIPASFDTLIRSSNIAAERIVTIPTIAADAEFVVTQTNQTLSGVKTFNDGVLLATSGGTPTNLNYYEEFDYTNTWSGPWASPQNGTLRVIRIGKLVTLFFPGVSFTGTVAAVITWDGTLNVRHRPAATVYGPASISNNLGAFSSTGRVGIQSGGTIAIGANNLGGAFSGTGSNGIINFSTSYFVT
jgi:hypothetical protein